MVSHSGCQSDSRGISVPVGKRPSARDCVRKIEYSGKASKTETAFFRTFHHYDDQ